MQKKILSIAIPTYNRAEWLRLCLNNLIPQLEDYRSEVEITVYDNASPDHTAEVATSFINLNLPLTYIRNTENIGSDRNIAQCFNKAVGKYVLILGDDDIVIPNGLRKIISFLKNPKFDHGVVYIRAYGYDEEFMGEMPFQLSRSPKVYWNIDKFVYNCASGMAFISSLIINKSKIPNIDANQFINTALVQTYLFYESAKASSTNLFVEEYIIAAKRIERRDYDVTKVFASGLNNAFEFFISRGLLRSTVDKLNCKLVWYFFPFFLMQLRLAEPEDVSITNESYKTLKQRYHNNLLFWIFLYPIMKWPKPLAKTWAISCVLISRLITLEFGRLYIAISKKIKKLKLEK